MHESSSVASVPVLVSKKYSLLSSEKQAGPSLPVATDPEQWRNSTPTALMSVFGINRENALVCIALYIFIAQHNEWVCKINISDSKILQLNTCPLKELNCHSCTSTDLLKLMCYDTLSILFFLTWSSKFVASKLHSVKYCKANSILCFLSLFIWVLFSHFSSFLDWDFLFTSQGPSNHPSVANFLFLHHPVLLQTTKNQTSALLKVGLKPKFYLYHKAQTSEMLNFPFMDSWV